jgi:hypothetical protein
MPLFSGKQLMRFDFSFHSRLLFKVLTNNFLHSKLLPAQVKPNVHIAESTFCNQSPQRYSVCADAYCPWKEQTSKPIPNADDKLPHL